MIRTIRYAAVLALALTACSDSNNRNRTTATTTISGTLAPEGLNTLSAALRAADLEDDLAAAGAFTLLAPSDAAFAALPAGTLDSLLLPQNKAVLIDILQYHLIAGEAKSDVVATLTSSATAQGGTVLIDQIGADLVVNDARVTKADIEATNGVIHIIDKVLLPPQNIVDTLVASGFSTLATAVGAADLVTTLDGTVDPDARFTVLAPTDAAFAALPAGVLASLLEPANKGQLTDILTYHVISGSVRASDALGAETPKALNDLTLLFAASESGATVNGVTISSFNVPCTNGVIHIIDAVLLPPADIATLAGEAGLTTLVTALVAAELDDDLAGAGPFTVFAPTNAAFDALPAGALATLLEPANQALLADVLLYHVVADELSAAEVLASTSLTALNADEVSIGTEPPTVNAAPISATNVLARNGIVHVIDSVLLPPGFALPAEERVSMQAKPSPVGPSFGTELHDFTEFGTMTLPAWYGAPDSQAAAWSDFDSTANPVRPDVDGSGDALLFLERATLSDEGRAVRWNSLPGGFRISQPSDSVPLEVVLNVTTLGAGELEVELRFARPDGVIEALSPDQVESFSSERSASNETVFTWRPKLAGQQVDSFDLVATSEDTPLGIDSLRVLSID